MKRKFILMAMLMYCSCFNVYSQTIINEPGNDDGISQINKQILGANQYEMFNEVTNGYQNFSVNKGSYKGVYYQINVEIKPGSFNKYIEVVTSSIDKLINANVHMPLLMELTLEVYFMNSERSNPGKSLSNLKFKEEYRDFAEINAMAFTHNQNWDRVNRIVIKSFSKGDFSWGANFDPNKYVGSLLHCVGHIMHEQTLGTGNLWGEKSSFNKYISTRLPDKVIKEPNGNTVIITGGNNYSIGEYVSNHATRTKREYVAEVFTYILMGRFYDKVYNVDERAVVLGQYRYWKGPTIPGF